MTSEKPINHKALMLRLKTLMRLRAAGARSDGWRDDVLPRRIRYWTDDLQLLLSFVRSGSGSALAYLPEAATGERDLVRLQVTDCPFT